MNEKLSGVYNASNICGLIKDFDGKTLTVTEQKDIDEFFNLFTDRLDNCLKNTANSDLIKSVYGGLSANEIICLDCPHRSEKIEEFLSVSLQIKSKKSIQESLKSFIETEKLEGNDCYYCERCEKKVKAKKRTTFKILPNYLIFILKRFDYDYTTGQKKKINDYYEFPFELSMEEFTQEFNLRKDLSEKNTDLLTEDEKLFLTNPLIPNNYYGYKLKGVVLHMGTADSGHYTSLISAKNDTKWYEFNDEKVTEFHPNRMSEEAFGGQQENISKELSMIDSSHELFSKIKNAYVLVYERNSYYKIPELELILQQKTREISQFERAKILVTDFMKINSNPKILQKALCESAKNTDIRTILSTDYSNFVTNLFMKFNILSDLNKKADFNIENLQDIFTEKSLEKEANILKSNLNSFKYFSLFIFTVFIRLKDTQISQNAICQVLKFYKKLIQENIEFAIFLMENFGHNKFIEEFLIYCPNKNARFFVISVMRTAWTCLFNNQKSKIIEIIKENKFDEILSKFCKNYSQENNKDICILEDNSVKIPSGLLCLIFIHNLLGFLHKLIINSEPHLLKVFKEITFLLSILTNKNPEITKFLYSRKFIGFAFEILFDSPAQFIAEFNQNPLYLLNKPLFLANNDYKIINEPAKKAVVLSEFKKIKYYRFFIEIFGQVFTNLILPGNESKLKTSKNPEFLYEMNMTEANCLNYFFEPKLFSKFFSFVNTRISAYGIGKILAKCSENNEFLNEKCIQLIFEKLIRAEIKELPFLIIILYQLLNFEDSIKIKRIKLFSALLKQALNKNLSESYISYTFLADLFIKLVLDNEWFFKIIENDLEKFEYIKDWINHNNYPADGYVYWLNTPNKKIVIKNPLNSDGIFFYFCTKI